MLCSMPLLKPDRSPKTNRLHIGTVGLVEEGHFGETSSIKLVLACSFKEDGLNDFRNEHGAVVVTVGQDGDIARFFGNHHYPTFIFANELEPLVDPDSKVSIESPHTARLRIARNSLWSDESGCALLKVRGDFLVDLQSMELSRRRLSIEDAVAYTKWGFYIDRGSDFDALWRNTDK